MPAVKPPEFWRRGLDLAAQVTNDFGVSESCLRRWVMHDDVDSGRKEGLTNAEREGLVELRRRNQALGMEIEILERASA